MGKDNKKTKVKFKVIIEAATVHDVMHGLDFLANIMNEDPASLLEGSSTGIVQGCKKGSKVRIKQALESYPKMDIVELTKESSRSSAEEQEISKLKVEGSNPSESAKDTKPKGLRIPSFSEIFKAVKPKKKGTTDGHQSKDKGSNGDDPKGRDPGPSSP